MARSKIPTWMDHLPLVLLGIRTSVRQDLDWCPAELVYGATLRLPGEFLFPPEPDSMPSPSTAFVARLRASLAAMRPAPAAHHRPPAPSAPGIPPSLADVSHVYLRVDAVRRPLCRPYEGPFKVLRKEPKSFVLSRAGKAWTVSVDRLKPAWGFVDLSPVPLRPPVARHRRISPADHDAGVLGRPADEVPDAPAGEVSVAPADGVPDVPAAVLTRSGRLSRPPSRL